MIIALLSMLLTTATTAPATSQPFHAYVLDFATPVDRDLQAQVEKLDKSLRERFDMKDDQSAVGVLDLTNRRLAMIRPDAIEYAASVPKIGILLAYFSTHAEGAENLDATTRHELGRMIKLSDNEMAAKYSRLIGLKRVQEAINEYHLYDKDHGGGIWVGKHYGKGDERYGDPIADHSHAATVRQLLRYYLLLEQGRLVSPQASRAMRQIFESPDIPHDVNKFVKGLAGREELKIIRKSGTWQDWLHDTAVINGPGRHYILVALTRHKNGDAYLEALAPAVDDLMKPAASTAPSETKKN